MGTSGDRKGYKIFSINTSIRNPVRNYDFLRVFEPFDGITNTTDNLYKYYFELIKNGIYQSLNVPSSVTAKWDNNIELTSAEVKEIISKNPQATGDKGRVMTMLRALKDQGLLRFKQVSGKRSLCQITITELGKQLLRNPAEAPTIYTKIMLSMHANNPCRNTMWNRSIPFLNTLFVIREVNKMWAEIGNEAKGILYHEFATFVLSMKDCDYKAAAKNIIEYRKIFGLKYNRKYCYEFLQNNDILALKENSLLKDYPDEVFRKFEMTGLVVKHGAYQYVYITFSAYNMEKINSILTTYENYHFVTFASEDDYYRYQNEVTIPWESSDKIRRKIVEAKAAVLRIPLDENMSLADKEHYLDSLFYNKALKKACDKYDIKQINKELLILAGSVKGKSIFESLTESLRLEYLLALLLGKKYGTDGLVSNIIYNEDGLPLHCAVGGKCDISFHNEKGSYILEPTMLRGKDQQLNSETTNIVRHAQTEETKYGIQHRVMMIAPRIHADIVDFFIYKVVRDKAKIISFSIEKTVGLFSDSDDIISLNENYDNELNKMIDLGNVEYADLINAYKFNQA